MTQKNILSRKQIDVILSEVKNLTSEYIIYPTMIEFGELSDMLRYTENMGIAISRPRLSINKDKITLVLYFQNNTEKTLWDNVWYARQNAPTEATPPNPWDVAMMWIRLKTLH